jgi:hypothetical protein
MGVRLIDLPDGVEVVAVARNADSDESASQVASTTVGTDDDPGQGS